MSKKVVSYLRIGIDLQKQNNKNNQILRKYFTI